jgi:hypothetical protein
MSAFGQKRPFGSYDRGPLFSLIRTGLVLTRGPHVLLVLERCEAFSYRGKAQAAGTGADHSGPVQYIYLSSEDQNCQATPSENM